MLLLTSEVLTDAEGMKNMWISVFSNMWTNYGKMFLITLVILFLFLFRKAAREVYCIIIEKIEKCKGEKE